jgi:hypothetical protein
MAFGLLEEALQHSVEAFRKNNIPVIVVKGMDLANRIYPNPTLRSMTDIDLLVPAELYAIAIEVLLKNGYRQFQEVFSNSFRGTLARKENPVYIDLHQKLLSDDTDEELKNYFISSEIDPKTGVNILNINDCFIYTLRHHAFQHSMDSSVWFLDIHLLIEQNLYWDFILKKLEQKKSLAAALMVFEYLVANHGSKIPKQVLAFLRDKNSPLRRQFAKSQANQKAWFPSQGRSRKWLYLNKLFSRDSNLDAAQYFFRRLGRIIIQVIETKR